MDPRTRLRWFSVAAIAAIALNVWFVWGRSVAPSEVTYPAPDFERPSAAAIDALADGWIGAVSEGDEAHGRELLALERAAELALEDANLAAGSLEVEQDVLRSIEGAVFEIEHRTVGIGSVLRRVGTTAGDQGTWVHFGVIHPSGTFDHQRLLAVAGPDGDARFVDRWLLSGPPRLSLAVRRDVVDPEARPLRDVDVFPAGAGAHYRDYLAATAAAEHEAAAVALEALAEALETDGYAWCAASSARQRAGALDAARLNADRAVQAEPGLLEAHVQRALIASHQADDSAVAEELEVLAAKHGLKPDIFDTDPAWKPMQALPAYTAWAAALEGG